MLNPGDTVGHYVVDGLIGQGGMGQVYKATDPRLERVVALKVIAIPEGSDVPATELSARLYREARAVASLSHPNVVGVYDVGEDRGMLFLAMEYVTGDTLRAYVAAGRAMWPRKVRWLVDVARALAAAHKAGIIHRDVKPENVIVREDGVVKVLDFGIARRTMIVAGDTVTGGGKVTGTPVYMSPEQIRADALDGRADQFSWGVMAYELLTGERPWTAEKGNALPVLAAIISEPPPPFSPELGLPMLVETVVVRALAKRPGDRFESLDQVAEALDPFAGATSGDSISAVPSGRAHQADAFAATTRVPTTLSPAPPRTTEDPPPTRKRRSRLRWLALSLAIAALGIVVWRARPRTPPVIANPTVAVSRVPEAAAAFRAATQLFHDGSVRRSMLHFEDAVKADPTLASAHLRLALLMFASDPADAQEHFAQAFHNRHFLTRAEEDLLHAAEAFVKPRPDLVEWETRMQRAVHEHGRDPLLHFYLGQAREAQHDYDAAKLAYAESLKIDPEFLVSRDALAGVEKNLGNVSQAMAHYGSCLEASPVATTCLEHRGLLRAESGECGAAREDAASWSGLEPENPDAQLALALALASTGAERPSVEEVLRRRIGLLKPPERAAAALEDERAFAVMDGRFKLAIERASALEEKLPGTATREEHASLALGRARARVETGDLAEAGAEAKAFLSKMDAWPRSPLEVDPSLELVAIAARAGLLRPDEVSLRRARWLEGEAEKTHGDATGTGAKDGVARSRRDVDRHASLLWADAYAAPVESATEAREALDVLPRYTPLLPASRATYLYNFALGKAFFFGGRYDDAILRLSRVAGACIALRAPLVHTRAQFLLGQAYEARGDVDAAKRSYAVVVERWGAAEPASLSAKKAAARLDAIARRTATPTK